MASNLINVISDSARLMKTKLDSDVRTASMNMLQFRSLSRPVASFGKNKGNTVEIEKYGKLTVSTLQLLMSLRVYQLRSLLLISYRSLLASMERVLHGLGKQSYCLSMQLMKSLNSLLPSTWQKLWTR